MNLIDLYDSLPFPDSDDNVFNAIQIPGYSTFRIAVDIEGNAIILLSVASPIKNIGLKNFRLQYLRLEQNVTCKITENGNSSVQTFTVITFTSGDRNLQKYFIRISETLIKTLGNRPTQQQIIESLNKFVEVFRALTDTPTNTVHGLWTELFLIENSTNPNTLLSYWHNLPEEKFDFNSGNEKVEVKSNSSFERRHIFSSEQLNPPSGAEVLIASIFVKQNNTGVSIQQLVENITLKVSNDFDLIEKLNNIVCKTLGSSLEQSIRIKFDYEIARNSLLFFNYLDIGKIEEIHIPSVVADVHYESDLTKVTSTSKILLESKGDLFKSL